MWTYVDIDIYSYIYNIYTYIFIHICTYTYTYIYIYTDLLCINLDVFIAAVDRSHAVLSALSRRRGKPRSSAFGL